MAIGGCVYHAKCTCPHATCVCTRYETACLFKIEAVALRAGSELTRPRHFFVRLLGPSARYVSIGWVDLSLPLCITPLGSLFVAHPPPLPSGYTPTYLRGGALAGQAACKLSPVARHFDTRSRHYPDTIPTLPRHLDTPTLVSTDTRSDTPTADTSVRPVSSLLDSGDLLVQC